MGWKGCSDTPAALGLLEEAGMNMKVALPWTSHVWGSTFSNHLLLANTDLECALGSSLPTWRTC